MSLTFPEIADRAEIVDTVTRLFVFTDHARWDEMLATVFAGTVDFDGGFGEPASQKTAESIVDAWRTGLAGLDAVHHQAGNFLVELDGAAATVHADAIAVHAKQSATNGATRTFIGSYTIGMQRQSAGWRIDRFVYDRKFVDGNADLS